MKMMQDGVRAWSLPDGAKYEADEALRSPLNMDDCPCGNDICTGDCNYYEED